MTMEPQKMI